MDQVNVKVTPKMPKNTKSPILKTIFHLGHCKSINILKIAKKKFRPVKRNFVHC